MLKFALIRKLKSTPNSHMIAGHICTKQEEKENNVSKSENY